jgi:tRNA G10  N-methylase Trm11
MDTITPNKEIIRRICILNGGTYCYISHTKGDNFIEILADIKEEKLTSFSKELSEWSGINYKVYSIHSQAYKKNKLEHINDKILGNFK